MPPPESKPEEPPAPPPDSKPDEPRVPEKATGDDVVGAKPSILASEPSSSSPQPIRDLAGAGWVKIPNKGRISVDVKDNPDTSTKTVRRGPDPAPEHQAQADGPSTSSRGRARRHGAAGRGTPMFGPWKERLPRQRASGGRAPAPIRPRNHGPTRDGLASSPRSTSSTAVRTSGRSPGCTTATAAAIIGPSGRPIPRNIRTSKRFTSTT